MQLAGQLALVTGAASGMGQACVQAFREQGVNVVLWDRTPISNEPDALVCDVRVEASVEQTMAATLERYGTPRILVNCAGIATAKRIVGREGPMPMEAFREVIEVNLLGSFNVMRLMAAALSKLSLAEGETERGLIINTASIAAFDGQIGQAAYSASKGGLVALTLPAARELAAWGIRVNTIAPGLIATPMLLNMPAELQQSLASTIPFPKRFGKPEEFAALVLHIVENSLINGEVIRLDGALRMQP